MCQGFDQNSEKFWKFLKLKSFWTSSSAPTGSCKALPNLGEFKKITLLMYPLWFPECRSCSVTPTRLSRHFPLWSGWPSHSVSCAHGNRLDKQGMLWHLGLHLDLGLYRGLLKSRAALCFQDYVWMGEKIFLCVHLYIIGIALVSNWNLVFHQIQFTKFKTPHFSTTEE